jgi:hypothetical protein
MTINIVEDGSNGRGLRGITSFVKDKLAGSIPPGNVWDQGRSVDFTKQEFPNIFTDLEQTTEPMKNLVEELQGKFAEGWNFAAVLQDKEHSFNDYRFFAVIFTNPSRTDLIPTVEHEYPDPDFIRNHVDLSDIVIGQLEGTGYKFSRLSRGFVTVGSKSIFSDRLKKHVQMGVAYVLIGVRSDLDKPCSKEPLFSPSPVPVLIEPSAEKAYQVAVDK